MLRQSIKGSAIGCLFSIFIITFVASAHRQEEFRVTEASLTAEDARMSGPCPMKVVFNGYIKTNGPGTIRYTFTRSDGATAPIFTLTFEEAGTQRVNTDWTLSDADVQPPFEGWERIKILSPNSYESSQAKFEIECQPGKEKRPDTNPADSQSKEAEGFRKQLPNLSGLLKRKVKQENAEGEAGQKQQLPNLSPLPKKTPGLESANDTSAKTKTFVIPHILEKSGTITSTQFTFDTNLIATYAAGLGGTAAGPGAKLELYLFDNSAGAPLKTNGADVCNPCSFFLDSVTRKVTIWIDDLITVKGGFDAPVKLGFGVIVVGGDADNVSLQGLVVNAHTSAFDLSVFGFEPMRVGIPKAKTFVIPHILEKSGTITSTQFTFDTNLFATYTAGLAGTPAGPGATLDLFLLDNLVGAPLKNNGVDVCNPCSYKLDSSKRKESIRIDDLITVKGGFDAAVKLGFGVIVVGGDADNVSLQGFVLNAHSSPFDLGGFGFTPTPLGPGPWK